MKLQNLDYHLYEFRDALRANAVEIASAISPVDLDGAIYGTIALIIIHYNFQCYAQVTSW